MGINQKYRPWLIWLLEHLDTSLCTIDIRRIIIENTWEETSMDTLLENVGLGIRNDHLGFIPFISGNMGTHGYLDGGYSFGIWGRLFVLLKAIVLNRI